jgi:protein gp37
MDVWRSLYGSDRHLTKTHDNPRRWNREAQALGRRYKVFYASLSDIFEPHLQVKEARVRLWQLIEETPLLDWQILTKRPKFIRNLVPQPWLQRWPENVWIGTSVGMQRAAEQRIPYLLDLPAPVLFLSCEPLVEEITLEHWLQLHQINWVICGGYSGTQNRPMQLSRARKVLAECREYRVAFFMKQLGSVPTGKQELSISLLREDSSSSQPPHRRASHERSLLLPGS